MPFTLLTTSFGSMIYRAADGAYIPVNPSNADYQNYQAWLSAGSPAVWPTKV
jgi:hypothetical protein